MAKYISKPYVISRDQNDDFQYKLLVAWKESGASTVLSNRALARCVLGEPVRSA